jgi:hypothetical protein
MEFGAGRTEGSHPRASVEAFSVVCTFSVPSPLDLHENKYLKRKNYLIVKQDRLDKNTHTLLED